MGSAIIGIVIGVIVVGFTLNSMSVQAIVFFNLAGIVFVTGASIGAVFVTYDIKSVGNVFISILRVLRRRDKSLKNVVTQIIDIAWAFSRNPEVISSMAKEHRNSFVGDGLRLIENGFDSTKIQAIMKISTREQKNDSLDKVDVIRTAAKYPPAFGMIGTVLGLIALLHGLGPSSDTSSIGASMSVALTTTLYGLLLANYGLIPMADNLETRVRQDLAYRRVVLEGMLMLNEKEDPVLIQETLNAYLRPAERLDLKEGIDNSWRSEAS
jgi:chemotaxis protein MotA